MCSLLASWDDKVWLGSMPCITSGFPFHSPRGLRDCGRRNDGLWPRLSQQRGGGAYELIDNGRTGLRFTAGDSNDLPGA